MSEIKLKAFGGAEEVTGANFMLETSEGNILIDCGMSQGGSESSEKNREDFQYDVMRVSAILITHAHMDHIGRLGLISKLGFNGTVYGTPETKEIASLMLDDAVRLEAMRADKEKVEPSFGAKDIDNILSKWKTFSYYEEFSPLKDVSVKAYDAGHILGSAMFLTTIKTKSGDKKILFTGDLGNSPSVLLRDTDKVPEVDYILMESVYGDRNHEKKEDREEIFLSSIKKTIDRGGAVIIPAFSLERTQELLFLLDNFIESGRLPQVPVFLDSPLAIRVTKEYEEAFDLYKKDVQKDILSGDKIFSFSKLRQTARRFQSEDIASVPNPKIIIAGSGMSTGGRILMHEMRHLPDEKSMIILAGYQAVGTLGRKIEEGEKDLVIEGVPVKVRAEIVTIKGFSGHKDSDGLVEFVSDFEPLPKTVFVAMGELKASTFLAQRLSDELGVKAVVMRVGEEYEIA